MGIIPHLNVIQQSQLCSKSLLGKTGEHYLNSVNRMVGGRAVCSKKPQLEQRKKEPGLLPQPSWPVKTIKAYYLWLFEYC
jgi:hypothetical protein